MTIGDLRKLLHCSTLELSRRRGLKYGYTRGLCQEQLAMRPDFLPVLLHLAEDRMADLVRAVDVLVRERMRLVELGKQEQKEVRLIRRGLERVATAFDLLREETHAKPNDRYHPDRTPASRGALRGHSEQT